MVGLTVVVLSSMGTFLSRIIAVTWNSLNRLSVQQGRCRAMVKMWTLSHIDVCDGGERQTMFHLMTCVDAPNCTWTDLAMPPLAGGVNCAKHGDEYI